MYGFWYDYIKQKHKLYCKLCFTVYVKTDDTYKNIAEDVNTRFDTLNYKFERPLTKIKTKKSN